MKMMDLAWVMKQQKKPILDNLLAIFLNMSALSNQ